MQLYLERICLMDEPQDLFQKLTKDQLFQDWQKQNQNYLTHFFCALDDNAKPLTNWEIGFFSQKKVSVFAFLDNGKLSIKPADDIFKRETDKVEKLDLIKVKVSFEQA